MAQQNIIDSEQRLKDHKNYITKLWSEKKYLRISILIGRDRTVDQNRLSFDIYRDLWKAGKFESVTEARAYCKLTHGVPILFSEDEGFKKGLNKLGKYNLTYEDKLSMMIEPINIPVTSRMTRKQFSKYVDAIGWAFPDVEIRSLE